MQGTWLIVFVVIVSSHLTGQAVGRISGTVINEDGQVVEQADVCTSVTAESNTTTSCRIPVDKEGQFQIENVKFGSYGLSAINEAEGYSIENQRPGLRVAVTPKNPSPKVTIRLRPRGAVLTGSIRDKVTGKPVEGAWINYIDIDNGGGGGAHRIDGRQFVMAAPMDTDLLIYVSANGYKGWVYTDPSNPARPLVRFASGERRVLDMELEPLLKTSAMN
jgi:hypothetical protein